MKKYVNPVPVAYIVVAIFIIQSVLIAISLNKIHKLETAKPSNQNQALQGPLAVGMSALSATSFNQPAVSVADNKVYLPDIHLSLPLNDTSFSILYLGRQTGTSEDQTFTTYDVTTRSLASLSPIGFQQQLACYPVRLAFEDKSNPFNPHEKNNSSVKLTDGRTLQIYANNNDKCDAQWQAADINPGKIKQIFDQALSY